MLNGFGYERVLEFFFYSGIIYLMEFSEVVGDFVGSILADSGQIEGYKLLRKVSLPELVVKVSTYLDADKDEKLIN